jgi:hypothetical protein
MRSIAIALATTTAAVVLASNVAEAAPPAAAAGPDRKACIAAADDGQKLRDENKLSAAREKFILCASKSCPGAVAKECSQWLQDAERDMPSVTFRARDERGKEILDVRVFIDDQAVAESIDARALPVDPGEHKFKFARSDGKFVEDKIVLRPAEKNKLIELSFQGPAQADTTATPKDGAATSTVVAPPPEPGEGFKIPILGYVGAGVAVVGVGMMAFFAITANNDEQKLRDTCAPNCPESERDSIDSKVLLANVGMGVAVVGVGVAVVSTVLANSGTKSTSAKSGRARPGVTGGVAPTHGGAAFGLSGSF